MKIRRLCVRCGTTEIVEQFEIYTDENEHIGYIVVNTRSKKGDSLI